MPELRLDLQQHSVCRIVQQGGDRYFRIADPQARRFGSGDHSARFTDDVCEGHYGRARQRVLVEFARRCALLGIDIPSTNLPAAGEVRESAPAATFNEQASLAAGDK